MYISKHYTGLHKYPIMFQLKYNLETCISKQCTKHWIFHCLSILGINFLMNEQHRSLKLIFLNIKIFLFASGNYNSSTFSETEFLNYVNSILWGG